MGTSTIYKRVNDLGLSFKNMNKKDYTTELTNISISTTSLISKLDTAKMLIFDSISTLLVYNDFETVKDFIHFISKKMKELKVTFAMICIKDRTDEKVISQLSAFVDEVIEIE